MSTTVFTHFSRVNIESAEVVSIEEYDDDNAPVSRSEVIEIFLDDGFELREPVTYTDESGYQIIIDTFVYLEPTTHQEEVSEQKPKRRRFRSPGRHLKSIFQEELGISRSQSSSGQQDT